MKSAEETGPRRGVVGALNRALRVLIVLAIFTVIGVMFIPEIQRHRQERAALQKLESEVQERETALAARTRELQLIRNDPAYVEVLARDKLDLMKEGETIFRIDPKALTPEKSPVP